MVNIIKTLLDGLILSVIASIFLVIILRINPRLFLQDYPEEIQSQVPPKTDSEKRQSIIAGIPFLALLFAVPFISTLTLQRQFGGYLPFLQLFLNAFGVGFIFNLVDLILLDWIMFCTFTPKFLVIPGTEGMEAYKDYGYHFRASLIGTVISVVAGFGITGLVILF